MKNKFPELIPVFPLSGVIFFPKTNLPLNIFEERYIELVNDCIKKDKLMGMVQSKKNNNEVYSVGCLGKINDLQKTEDGRILINLSGLIRFEIKKEVNNNKRYREFQVDYQKYNTDLTVQDFNFELFKSSYNDLIGLSKEFFEKNGLMLNWKEFQRLSLDQQVNTLAMIAPMSNGEKQKLIETISVNDKIENLRNIFNFYKYDNRSKDTNNLLN